MDLVTGSAAARARMEAPFPFLGPAFGGMAIADVDALCDASRLEADGLEARLATAGFLEALLNGVVAMEASRILLFKLEGRCAFFAVFFAGVGPDVDASEVFAALLRGLLAPFAPAVEVFGGISGCN